VQCWISRGSHKDSVAHSSTCTTKRQSSVAHQSYMHTNFCEAYFSVRHINNFCGAYFFCASQNTFLPIMIFLLVG
jgi:hypothetical protein